MSLKAVLCVLCASCLLTGSLEAAYILKGGKLVDADESATLPVDQHFELGMAAYEAHDWDEAARQFYIVVTNFPQSSYGREASYFLGIAYFVMEEFEFANIQFTHYIKGQNHPKHFEEAMQYKFRIANAFRDGARRRILGYKQLPKWLSAKEMALDTYDEVIATVPCHELAAQSLYNKGCLLWEMEDYRLSVEAFQVLIRRFPKHELAPECYLCINQVFLEQSEREIQNPDLLALAQLNVKKFKHDFPGEPRLTQAEEDVMEMKELYARGLYETGQFYERLKKPDASKIYYKNAIQQFPDTSMAQECRERLDALEAHG